MGCPSSLTTNSSPHRDELPSIFALMSLAMLTWTISVCLFYLCLLGVRELSTRHLSNEDTVDSETVDSEDDLGELTCPTCKEEMAFGHECQLTPEEEAVVDEALAAHAEACGDSYDRVLSFVNAHPYGSDYKKRAAAEYLRKSK